MNSKGALLGLVFLLLLGAGAALWLSSDGGEAQTSGLEFRGGPLTPGAPAAEAPLADAGPADRGGPVERDLAPTRRAATATSLETELTIRVRFQGKAALGAQVFGTAPGRDFAPLGISDAEGLLRTTLEAGPWTISARKAGSATLSRSAFLQAGKSQQLTLDLPAEASIEGQVRMVTGNPVGAGRSIWAWSLSIPDPGRLLRRARNKRVDPRLHLGRTDSRGMFRIGGLVPGESYRLAAIGPGSLSDQGLVLAAGSRAELRLVPVVARVVSFRVENEGVLPGEELRVPGAVPSAKLRSGSKQLTLNTNPELWLTPVGKRLDSLPDRSGPFAPTVVAAYPGPLRSGEGTSADFEVQHPAFRPVNTKLQLEPLGDPVPWTEVVLQRQGSQQPGQLTLDVRLGEEVAAALRQDPRSLGTVMMAGQEGQPLELHLPALAELPITVAGIPPGRWTLRFVGRDGTLDGVGLGPVRAQVTVQPGKTERALMDLSEVAAVRLELEDEQGESWGGSLILAFTSDQGMNRFATLPGAPYILLGLGHGQYEFQISRLLGSPLKGGVQGVSVEAGQLGGGLIRLGN